MSFLFEEFVLRNAARTEGLFDAASQQVAVHGHCHAKALVGVDPVLDTLSLAGYLPLDLKTGCCGMAGSFGYEASHQTVSMAMAEASLLPAVRAAGANDLIVADGTSCRHQIHDGAQRDAVHVARVLEAALLDAR